MTTTPTTTPTTGSIVDASTVGTADTDRPGSLRHGVGNNGILTAVRLNLVGARTRLAIPWAVAASGFLITIAIFALVRATDPSDGGGVSGALAALYLSVAIGYLQAMTQTFGFVLSLGMTRRNFYLGVGLLVLGESLLHAALLTVLRVIEDATNGWGLDMGFFAIPFVVQDNLFAQVLTYAAPMVALSAIALMAGTVFKRWGQTGVFAAGIASILVLGGLAVLVTWLGAWSAIGGFLAAVPGLVLIGVVPLVVAALAGLVGYLLVRHATP